jgi:hypothetical protein
VADRYRQLPLGLRDVAGAGLRSVPADLLAGSGAQSSAHSGRLRHGAGQLGSAALAQPFSAGRIGSIGNGGQPARCPASLRRHHRRDDQRLPAGGCQSRWPNRYRGGARRLVVLDQRRQPVPDPRPDHRLRPRTRAGGPAGRAQPTAGRCRAVPARPPGGGQQRLPAAVRRAPVGRSRRCRAVLRSVVLPGHSDRAVHRSGGGGRDQCQPGRLAGRAGGLPPAADCDPAGVPG